MPPRTLVCCLQGSLSATAQEYQVEANLTVVNVPDHPKHRALLQDPIDLIKRLVRSKPVNTSQKSNRTLSPKDRQTHQ